MLKPSEPSSHLPSLHRLRRAAASTARPGLVSGPARASLEPVTGEPMVASTDRQLRPVPERQPFGNNLDPALILDREVQVVRQAHIAVYMGAGFLADTCHSMLKRKRARGQDPGCCTGRSVVAVLIEARGSGVHEAQAAGAGAGGARGGHGSRSTGCWLLGS